MPTLRNLEENLKKKPIKLNLGTPALTAHPDENGVMQGDGVKRRGRPKKIPQAEPDKLLKALDKRLKAKQLKEEKAKKLAEEKAKKAPKTAKEVAKDAPSSIVLPSTYKPSTTATIKVDLPGPEGPLTRAKPPPKRPTKPKTLESFTKSPTYQKGKKGISPLAPKNLPTHTPVTTPVTKSKPSIEKLKGSKQEKRLQRIAEDQAKDQAQKQLLAEVTAGKQLKPTKRKPLPSQVLEEVTKPKKLTPVGKRKTKAEKEAENEAKKPAQQQAQEAIEAVKKVLNPKKTFEVNEEEDEPVAELPNKKVLVVERNWAINHPEAMAEKPPDKGSRGNKVIDPALIAWYKKYPEAPQSIKWMKTTVSGQTYLAEHPEFTFQKGKAGRPTKAELESREKAKPKKSSPAETEAVKAYEERHTPKPTSPKSQAERKDASKEGVKAFAKALSTQLYSPSPKAPSMLALAKKKPKAEEPPSRIIPVVEDAKATAVKASANKPTIRELLDTLPTTDPDINARLDLSPEEKRDMQKQRDLAKIQITASGPGMRQILEQQKAQQAQEELEEEIDFLTEMYGPETALRLAKGKGEGFRRFQGKGILNEEGDSDTDSTESYVSDSGDEDESVINIKQCFNKGSGINISHNSIMPMSRPVGLHPALESSTMTMNPGAYNNIKPLMGHLMGGAVSTHIRRSEHMGRTMSHYGDHHSHPQMSPMGHYTKHIMKGGPVVPTMDDLLHHGVEHLKGKFGTAPDHAHNFLHTALHTANIPKELHPMAHYGLTRGLKSLVSMMGGNIGGSFWNDLGSKLGKAFTGVGDVAKDIVNGRDLKDSFSQIGDIAKDTAYSVGDDIKREAPGLLKQTNEIYNDPRTQNSILGLTTALNQSGMPEFGMPLSVANMGISNALDAGANKRDLKGQLTNRYADPAKKFLQRLGINIGGKVGANLASNLGNNLGRLADSGSDYLIRQMDGHGVGNDIAKKLGSNVGRLADSGSDYLIRQMDGHGLYAQGGKVGRNLAKKLAKNTERLADRGTDWLINQMDGHGVGNDIAKKLGSNVGRLADSGSDYLIRQMDGHGLYAQGGKVGRNLAKKLAKNTERLADRGTDWLINQMDGHGCGGEIGDGLYAQGRGVRHPKGSQEAKDHMAKLRAMRGKGMKQSKHSKPAIERDPADAQIARDRYEKEKKKRDLRMELEAGQAERDKRAEKKETERMKNELAGGEYQAHYFGKSTKPAGKGVGRKKKMKGGAMPPPSRSPITNPVLNGQGLYA